MLCVALMIWNVIMSELSYSCRPATGCSKVPRAKTRSGAHCVHSLVHFSLRSITPMATKVHMALRIFVLLTWMCDTME
jgi:hypothetical protein